RSVVVPSAMFAAGAIGNTLALVLMATSPVEQRRTHFYKLMFGLALTDLMGTCTTSPVAINIYATGAKLETHMPLCHYFSFMLMFAAFATMSVVCAMAVERYICLCHPYFYQCKLPKSYARYALIISWTLSGIIAALPLVGLGRSVAQFPRTWCFFDATSRRPQDRAFSIIFASITLLAIGVTLCCNVAAIYSVLALRRRQKALKTSQGPAGSGGRSLAHRFAELHMLVILVGVTIIFTSCFAPLMVRYKWVYYYMFCDPQQHRDSCDSVFGYLDSPAFEKSPTPSDSDMSFWAFCFHCLCDPPVDRSSNALARSRVLGSRASINVRRSPARNLTRNASTESILNPSRDRNCVNTQPLASDQILLTKFS
ncbi:hypothetical protein EGW08_011923, partial [Elysia chlorotica]